MRKADDFENCINSSIEGSVAVKHRLSAEKRFEP
jgi:hypothetical protein